MSATYRMGGPLIPAGWGVIDIELVATVFGLGNMACVIGEGGY